ncbi:MAG: sensor domain-containing protein [Thermodesulfobacteriota bacterium]
MKQPAARTKKLITALQNDLEMLSVLINAMPDIVCFKDGEGRWLYANDFDLKLFELEKVAYKGKKDSELARFSDFYREAFLGCEESDEQAWQARTMFRTEETIPVQDGPARTFDIIKIPLFYEDGSRRGLVVLGRDITEQKRYEKELERLNRTFAEAQRVAKIGHWLWDLKSGRVEWSDEVFRIFGRDPQSFSPTYEEVRTFFPPDDRTRLEAAMVETLATGKHFLLEHSIILPDGEQRTVRAEGELYRDAENSPDHILGVVLDTTELKSAENQLELATHLLENIIEGVAITDANAKILSVNKAFTEITGYSAAEVLGRNPNILKSARQDKAFYDKMWQDLLRKGRWSGEIWNRRKNGEIYPEKLTIMAVTDGRGRPSRYVSIFHDLTEVKSQQETIKIREYHDPLTGLANRKLLTEHLETAIKRAEPGDEVAVISLDLDAFKRINDSLGHVAGDILLQGVAERLSSLFSQENTVARLGGDEFCVLLHGEGMIRKSVEIADDILKSLSAPFVIGKEEVCITASLGVSVYPFDGLLANTLFKNAELAMYEAKQTGNTCKYFRKELDEKARRYLTLENALRMALEKGEDIVVFFQPKIDIRSGLVTGMEALARWLRADGTIVSPAEFIPLAEETGLILPLGELVLAKALQATGKWLQRGTHVSVAVNLSPLQFKDEKLLERIVTRLEKYDFPPQCLELEITEGAVLEREQEAIAVLSRLRERGICISLDDFGTGYSSLYYLKKLPINAIKIDKSFIDDIPANPDSAAITTAIINIAKSLDLQVVAEGVERRDQLTFLKKNGCDQIQGYFYSPPVPEEKMGAFLSKGYVQPD